MSKSKFIADFSGLDRFVRGIFGPPMIVRVGILGKKGYRAPAGALKSVKKGGGHRVDKTAYNMGESAVATNAEIGAIHELGSFSRGIPARSFLRMPLHQKQAQILREGSAKAADKLWKGDMTGILKRFGIACENAVQDAFGSRGFGQWAPDATSTARAKRSDAPLIDTAQLRRSIASDVVPAGAA